VLPLGGGVGVAVGVGVGVGVGIGVGVGVGVGVGDVPKLRAITATAVTLLFPEASNALARSMCFPTDVEAQLKLTRTVGKLGTTLFTATRF
jgi:hypothetical protein